MPQQPRPPMPPQQPQPMPQQQQPRPPSETTMMLSQVLSRVNEMKNLMHAEMIPKLLAACSQKSGSMIPLEVNALTGIMLMMAIGMVAGLVMTVTSAIQYHNQKLEEQAAFSLGLNGAAVFTGCAIVALVIAFYFFISA